MPSTPTHRPNTRSIVRSRLRVGLQSLNASRHALERSIRGAQTTRLYEAWLEHAHRDAPLHELGAYYVTVRDDGHLAHRVGA